MEVDADGEGHDDGKGEHGHDPHAVEDVDGIRIAGGHAIAAAQLYKQQCSNIEGGKGVNIRNEHS